MSIRTTSLARGGVIAGASLSLFLAACGRTEEPPVEHAPARSAGTVHIVNDTLVRSSFEASGTAQPLQQATLSTRLMGTVTAVLVREGDRVAAGQPLVQLDARDLAARGAQVNASIAEAEAMYREAETQAGRMRALHADSAATKAQLDAAETGLARATAGVRAARAAAGELGAMRSYATIRAPFAGIVTRRFVDPGAFAAPGAPLVTVQDASRLRVVASAAPDAVQGLQRGMALEAAIEGKSVGAIVEGVVPAMSGNLYTINAIVANPGTVLPGSAATLSLPLGLRSAIVVPASAVTREGDLTGVTVRRPNGDELRWIRVGATRDGFVEVIGGLREGDAIVVPPRPAKIAAVTPEA